MRLDPKIKRYKSDFLNQFDEFDEWLYDHSPVWLMFGSGFALACFILYTVDGVPEMPDGTHQIKLFDALEGIYTKGPKMLKYFDDFGYTHPRTTWDGFVADQCMAWEIDWIWEDI